MITNNFEHIRSVDLSNIKEDLVFHMWDTGEIDKFCKPRLAISLELDGEVLYKCDDCAVGAGTDIKSDKAVCELLSFFTSEEIFVNDKDEKDQPIYDFVYQYGSSFYMFLETLETEEYFEKRLHEKSYYKDQYGCSYKELKADNRIIDAMHLFYTYPEND